MLNFYHIARVDENGYNNMLIINIHIYLVVKFILQSKLFQDILLCCPASSLQNIYCFFISYFPNNQLNYKSSDDMVGGYMEQKIKKYVYLYNTILSRL